MKRQLYIFICISAIALCYSNEICDSAWPKCGQIENIVCERGERCLPEPGCEEIPPDPEFLKFIVLEHNRLRNDIASGKETRGFTGEASNMMSISYDKDLEYSARCNVNTCKFEHDRCRGTKNFRYAGQNMYYTTSSHEDLKNAVVEWYNEILLNSANVIDKFPSGRHDIGHFTQVIWAKTTKIGCATAKSNSADEGEKFYITCNYGPAGNMVGKTVYERGVACSKCPSDVKCNGVYPALCGGIDDSEVYGTRPIYSSSNNTIDPTLTNKVSGGDNKTILNGVSGMYDDSIAGIPLDSFKDMFINETIVLGIKSYGITGLHGIESIFEGNIFNSSEGLGLCRNESRNGGGSGMFINGNFIPGSLINGNFVPGTFFTEIFFPGIFINNNFLPGVFIESIFLPGTFINQIFIPGAFINGTFVPGTLINGKFSPGNFDGSKGYNDGMTFNRIWVPGFSGLYDRQIGGQRSSGRVEEISVRFCVSVFLCVLCFWKIM